ncbi:MAG: hypothetical protein HON90_13335, partial [Halobacteriovoraceae bacterium]|nr:hypothetical protein [Halobacteriovoraceae bacterium]
MEQEKVKKKIKRKVVVDLEFQMSLISSFFKIYLLSAVGFFLIVSLLLGKITMFAKENNYTEVLTYLQGIESYFLWLFFGVFIISTIITYYYGFRITLKVCGPIYAAKLFLRKIIDGEEYDKFTLRKDDYFLDLKDNLNEAIEKI